MISFGKEIEIIDQYLSHSNNNSANHRKASFIAIDEVGRGSVFGPVSVGGILFTIDQIEKIPNLSWSVRVDDSKRLGINQRNILSHFIQKNFYCKVSHVSVGFIEKYNINFAIQYGLYRVVQFFYKNYQKLLSQNPLLFILMDGNYRFTFPNIRMSKKMPPVITQVKGDKNFFSIASASIIAKVARDSLCDAHHQKNGLYSLSNNKGYGTKEHLESIKKYGFTRYHRKSFLKSLQC